MPNPDDFEATKDPHTFKLPLGCSVAIDGSRRTGTVIGRAEYTITNNPSYLLRYINGQGDQREDWFTADALDESSMMPGSAREKFPF